MAFAIAIGKLRQQARSMRAFANERLLAGAHLHQARNIICNAISLNAETLRMFTKSIQRLTAELGLSPFERETQTETADKSVKIAHRDV